MKKLLLLLIIPFLSFSQKNNKEVLKAILWETEECEKSFLKSDCENFPTSVSLEDYAPQVYNQDNTNMCVAYALASARTIRYARQKGLLNSKSINVNSFSPYFLHFYSFEDNKLVKNKFISRLGLNPVKALCFMQKSGIARMHDVEKVENAYPFSKGKRLESVYYPGSFEKQRADSLSAQDFKVNITWARTLDDIKCEISRGAPVFFGMFSYEAIPPAFMDRVASGSSDVWNPEAKVECRAIKKNGKTCKRKKKNSFYCIFHPLKSIGEEKKAVGHGMLIIAYDDDKHEDEGAFQILNSWGLKWGHNGKIWMKYSDFEKLVDVRENEQGKYDFMTYSVF